MLDLSLEEDLGAGDLTTLATVGAGVEVRAKVRIQEECVLSGVALFEPLVAAMLRRNRPEEEADTLRMLTACSDGTRLQAGDVACEIAGSARALLMIERTLLNLVGRMSGIATLTARFVDAVRAAGSSTRILDTRKTAPGHRVLEKYAVRCGGGHNHREGLFDGILIKDHHVAAAGGIAAAVRRALNNAPEGIFVEVECDNEAQVEEALAASARAILVDNFEPQQVRAVIEQVAGRARVEVSGGITLDTVAAYAQAEPDDISVGSLTHSAGTVDVSMEIVGVADVAGTNPRQSAEPGPGGQSGRARGRVT